MFSWVKCSFPFSPLYFIVCIGLFLVFMVYLVTFIGYVESLLIIFYFHGLVGSSLGGSLIFM